MRGNSGLEQRNGMISRLVRKAGRGVYYSRLILIHKKELLVDMEMMRHLGNFKCREPHTETKFKKETNILRVQRKNF